MSTNGKTRSSSVGGAKTHFIEEQRQGQVGRKTLESLRFIFLFIFYKQKHKCRVSMTHVSSTFEDLRWAGVAGASWSIYLQGDRQVVKSIEETGLHLQSRGLLELQTVWVEVLDPDC